jgi:hypothetical protein
MAESAGEKIDSMQAAIDILQEEVFLWLFFFTLLAVVYVSHVEDRFFNTPRL